MPPYDTYGHRPVQTTSMVAVAAFICAIVGIWIAAIPLGIHAQGEVDRSRGRLTGRGFASAAIVIGALEALITVVVVLVILNQISKSG